MQLMSFIANIRELCDCACYTF